MFASITGKEGFGYQFEKIRTPGKTISSLTHTHCVPPVQIARSVALEALTNPLSLVMYNNFRSPSCLLSASALCAKINYKIVKIYVVKLLIMFQIPSNIHGHAGS